MNDKSKSTLVLRAGVIVLLLAPLASISSSAAESKGKMSAAVVLRMRHWLQTGEASWYGLKFQGHKTATGEKYDMAALTCAHRTLPLGSWIRVTNLRTRKSIFVRVNDRGPMTDDRIVDLSYAAAQAVGLRGVDKVKLEGVNPDNTEMSRALVAQVGAHEMSLMPNR